MVFSRFIREMFGAAPQRGPGASPGTGPNPPAPVAAAPFDYAESRIPDASRGRIDKVLALIGDIEKAAAAEAEWNPMLIEIRQISEVYLPSLIRSYIDIPAAHRAEIFRKTGRSASFMLNDGLEKLTERLAAMSLSLAQGNIDAFNRTMRFIEMRYGEDPLPPG